VNRTVPAWAAALVELVCAEAGVTSPRLLWRRRSGVPSTGVARRGDATITVRAGSDPVDQRLTLLHELAHWLTPPARRRRAPHHGAAFYATAFALYRRHGIADADALRLEAARYPSALRHGAALGVPGARAALAERRAALRARRTTRTWRVAVPEHAVRLVREGRWHVCVTCRQRVVGRALARVLRARRAPRHVLWTAVPGEPEPVSA
jgi:hypothetical protein